MSLGVLHGMFVSAVTLAVAWATAATARYADYSGARMPFYHEDYPNRDSLPRDDYPERSPDASVPLDYKYEEPSSGKYEEPTENSVGENDAWEIDRKNNRLIDEDEDYNHDIDKYSEERSNHRVEDRPSTKGKMLKKDNHNLSHQGRRRFTNSKSRSRYWDHVEDNRDIETRNKIDIRNKFRPRGEVRRAGRRKAREREDVTSEAIFEADRNFESGETSEDEALSLQGIRKRVGYERRKDDGSFIPHRDLGSMAEKSYPNYEEYYDMKRALNIRNNLLPIPRTKETQASSSTTSVAERELSAVLSRHQRAEIEDPGGPTSRALDINGLLPTFPKGALDSEQQHVWNAFVLHNRSFRSTISSLLFDEEQ
ncbi:uncharacterized protein LOC111003335 [Pieris rapae]|uniref:uncharacterized protein LOC111003335 n=1 Tax=Pieris rapae TaxID=64459 RepID=UPI001E27AC88|nr:uncharacterized protein LOC111003335 [Pieris rapae]